MKQVEKREVLFFETQVYVAGGKNYLDSYCTETDGDLIIDWVQQCPKTSSKRLAFLLWGLNCLLSRYSTMFEESLAKKMFIFS